MIRAHIKKWRRYLLQHSPQNLWRRRLLGIALIIGGILGFLPVLGFWMLPLGIFVLSLDSTMIRRLRRKIEIRIERYFQARENPLPKKGSKDKFKK